MLLKYVSLASLCSISLINAETNTDTSKTPNQASKQIPTDKDAAAELAEFLSKNAPAAPLPTGSPQLDEYRTRAARIQKQHAQFVADVASGKIKPHAHLYETLPQHTEQLKSLATSLDQLKAETDPAKKEGISKAFFAALQPIGRFLENGPANEGYINLLSSQQQADLTNLEQAWEAADKDYDEKANPLHFIGTGQLYTITNLSVPIIVQAPPSSKVIFRTFGGGFFPNKLPLIELQANEAGIVQTEWVSYGDSSGDTVIGIRSASAPPAENLTITTVQLRLSSLPAIPENTPTPPTAPETNIPEN